MPKYAKGTRLKHKIAGFEIVVEKDSGTHVKGYAIFSNGVVDTRCCTYNKAELVEVKSE